jgi:NIMA (never in mitosis gene a)-related kinase
MEIQKVKQRASAVQEAELLSKLSHPNIVRHRDSFMSPDQNQLVIVMQYCDGGDLSQRCERSLP